MSQGRTATCLCSLPGCALAAPVPGSRYVPHPPTFPGRCWDLLGHKTFRSVSRVHVLMGKAPPPPRLPRLRWPCALLCQMEMDEK